MAKLEQSAIINEESVGRIMHKEFPELRFASYLVSQDSIMTEEEFTQAMKYMREKRVVQYAGMHVRRTNPNEPPAESIIYPIPNPYRKIKFELCSSPDWDHEGSLIMYNAGQAQEQVEWLCLYNPEEY
jgi:hypothetical protein